MRCFAKQQNSNVLVAISDGLRLDIFVWSFHRVVMSVMLSTITS